MRWLALSLGAGVVLGGAGGWWAMRRQVTVEARRLAQLMVDGAVVRPPVPPAPAGVGRSADGAGGGRGRQSRTRAHRLRHHGACCGRHVGLF